MPSESRHLEGRRRKNAPRVPSEPLPLETCRHPKIKTGFNPRTCRSNYQMEDLVRRGELLEARQLFDEMPHRNTISTNTLISGYVKSGNLCEARQMFDGMIGRNTITWTIMIGGYSQNKQTQEAFSLFIEMRRAGMEVDHVTIVSLLSAFNDGECSNQGFQRWAF